MNCRNSSTLLQRTRWRLKSALLGTAFALGAMVNAQVGTNYNFSSSTGTYTPITGGTVLVSQTTTTAANVNLDDGLQRPVRDHSVHLHL
ncbi:MAG: hypothetical protein IPK99_10995 [Flavobacteriales bacterium]|nr:hypothetical protein [Flavobacteriales bacterium]